MTPLLIAGSVFVALAGAFHVYVFVLESIRWSQPTTWRAFGIRSQADADTIKPMALNQGFYNLFLGVGALGGVAAFLSARISLATDETDFAFVAGTMNPSDAGFAIAVFACLCMVGAATVLFLSVPRSRRAALLQGLPPLLGVALLLLGR